MTDEREGQLNEPNLVDECVTSMEKSGEEYLKLYNTGWTDIPEDVFLFSVCNVLVRRGLINDLGIEILKRDGVIK